MYIAHVKEPQEFLVKKILGRILIARSPDPILGQAPSLQKMYCCGLAFGTRKHGPAKYFDKFP